VKVEWLADNPYNRSIALARDPTFCPVSIRRLKQMFRGLGLYVGFPEFVSKIGFHKIMGAA
jgi:hypothetical protein